MEFYHDGRAPQLAARVRRQAFARGPIRSWTTRAATKNARAAPSEISALRPYLAAVPRSLRKIRALEYTATSPNSAPRPPPTKTRAIGIAIHRYSYQASGRASSIVWSRFGPSERGRDRWS